MLAGDGTGFVYEQAEVTISRPDAGRGMHVGATRRHAYLGCSPPTGMRLRLCAMRASHSRCFVACPRFLRAALTVVAARSKMYSPSVDTPVNRGWISHSGSRILDMPPRAGRRSRPAADEQIVVSVTVSVPLATRTHLRAVADATGVSVSRYVDALVARDQLDSRGVPVWALEAFPDIHSGGSDEPLPLVRTA